MAEDDPIYGELLQYHLSLNPGVSVELFPSGKALLAALHRKPDLITIDFDLPDSKGDQLYKRVREIYPGVPVIIISGQHDISIALELIRMGVTDYLNKDQHTQELLWNAVVRIAEKKELEQEVQKLKTQLGKKYSCSNLFVGNSEALQKVMERIEKAAQTNINVSVSGETGTGKELVAKAIHFNSARSAAPFVAVNMAAIPPDLAESELFGHEKGAFTGAINRKAGRFEEAQGGTLFLDEIAELDLHLQGKLLRVLQERELFRVGGSKKINLDFRLIVASHKNLEHEVAEGRFREDLYYRIMGLPIHLPPLRERGMDKLLLARHFLEQFAKDNGMADLQLSPEAMAKLAQYHFPGNIRELKSIVELAAVLSNGDMVMSADITFTSLKQDGHWLNEDKTLRQHTCDIILHYLRKYDQDVVRTAEKLDIGKSTIYKMIQQKELVI